MRLIYTWPPGEAVNKHFGNISIVLGVLALFGLRVVSKTNPLHVLAFGAVCAVALFAVIFGALGLRKRADADGYLINRTTAGLGLTGGALTLAVCAYTVFLIFDSKS